MIQKSILKFREYNGHDIVSGISQGQLTGSHVRSTSANDWNGRGASDAVDFLAPFDCVVKAIARYDNAVFFESTCAVQTPKGIFENLWFQTCHINDKDFNLIGFYIGKRFKKGDVIYTEGNKGIGGLHMHMQQGAGKFDTSKTTAQPYYKTNLTYKYAGKTYAYYAPSFVGYEMPVTDFFYLEKGVEVVKGPSTVAESYVWKYTDESEDIDMVNMIDGYQCVSWLSNKVHFYKQRSNEDIGMISAIVPGKENYLARQTIDKNDTDKTIYCKINCNFFNMNDGTHYGVEQSFQNDFAPKQKEWYCLYLDKETSKPSYALSSDYWLGRDDVRMACSPAAILRYNNEDMVLISQSTQISLTQKTAHTLLLHLGNGMYAFMVTEGSLTLYQCRDCAKAYGAVDIYVLDGGGSSQMIVNGSKKLYTGRAVANVLCFYEKEQKGDEEDMLKVIHVDKVGLYIRDKVKGTIIGYIPPKSLYEFEKVEPVKNRQTDGYQWWHVKGSWIYKGVEYHEGFCQYDSSCYWVE